MTWGDAAILGVAVFGLLIGLSLVSYQVAVGAGIVMLAYVVVKLFTT